MWYILSLINSVWCIPKISCDFESLWGPGSHGKMDPVRAPINLNHSTLCPPCSICFLVLTPPATLVGKESAYNSGDLGSIPGLGRSPGEGNGNPLQHSCLENPMDGGAWQATVHGVAKSRTQLTDLTFLTVASWPAYKISQEAGKVAWYSHLFQNILQFVVIHSQRLWCSQ